jgi:hypothetical protein
VSGLLGLEQNWGVFAPEPRRDSLRIVALVDWSDGSRTVWRPRLRGAGLGAYGDYRWRKWEEHAGTDAEGRRLWPAAARFIARLLPRRGAVRPVALHLIRYMQPVPGPGSGARPGWRGTEVYRAQLVER